MIYLGKFCCVCLSVKQQLEKIVQKNDVSYYDKLSILFPEMNINDIKKIAFICSDCIKCTDDMFKFRTACLSNNNRLLKYISQLRLDKNDVLNITSQLIIIKQKIEMVDDPYGLKSITRLNEDENVLQSEDILNTTCDGELRTEEHIKKEVLDDDVIDNYQSESIYGNDNTNSYSKTNSDNNVDSSTETNESFKDTSNTISIDINKRIKCETFDYNVGKYEPEFENVSVNDNVNNTFETNVNRTATGLKDPLQNNSNIEGYQYVKVKMDDISSLHTEYNVNDCIKNETSNESIVKHISEKNEFSLNTNAEDNVDSVPKICGININPNISAESIIDDNNDNYFHSEDHLNKIYNLSQQINNVMCNICNKPLSTVSELRNHLSETHGWNKPSEISNNSFSQASSINTHNRIYTGERPYKCEICNKAFVSLYDFKRHYRIHTGEKPYKCEICDKSFTRPFLLTTHSRIHTGEKPYKCEICNKSFSQLPHLRVHSKIHTGEKPYKCDICNKSFTFLSSFNGHKISHTGEKPYTCKICNKSFSQASSLSTHNRLHMGIKKFKCEVCSKSFVSSCDYKIHYRIHTGEKPYKCEVCSKSFTRSFLLITHNRIHTGEKPYKCEICSKTFSFLSNFKGHVKTHNKIKPYTCNTCNKSFSHLSSLNTHNRIHTGENLIKCEICNKTFTRSSLLIMHNRIHTGEKPYECDVCNKSFNSLSNLKRHLKIHTEKKTTENT